MDTLRRLTIPLVVFAIVIGVGVGLVLGWQVWPVSWYDTDPSDLKVEHQVDYILMTADSLAVNGDSAEAANRLGSMVDDQTSRQELADLVESVAIEAEQSGDAASALRVRRLALAAGLPAPAAVSVPVVADERPARMLAPSRTFVMTGALIVFALAVALVAWALIRLLRRRTEPQEDEWLTGSPDAEPSDALPPITDIGEPHILDVPRAEPPPEPTIVAPYEDRRPVGAPAFLEPERSSVLDDEPVASIPAVESVIDEPSSQELDIRHQTDDDLDLADETATPDDDDYGWDEEDLADDGPENGATDEPEQSIDEAPFEEDDGDWEDDEDWQDAYVEGEDERVDAIVEREPVAPNASLSTDPELDEPAPPVHSPRPTHELASPDATSEALGVFESDYRYGDDDFDTSFAVESADGEFLGECGMSVGDILESDEAQKVDALEVWLFDKNGIRTEVRLLVSEYVYAHEALNAELSEKGELIVPELEQSFVIETLKLQMTVTIKELAYVPDADLPESAFERLAIEMFVERSE